MAKRQFIPRRKRIPFKTFNPNSAARDEAARRRECAQSLEEIEIAQRRLERLFGFKEDSNSGTEE